MWSKFALVKEQTVHCEFGLYFRHDNGAEYECLSSGKYALIDLTDPTGDGKFFCTAHFCGEHALAGLTISHDFATMASRKQAEATIATYRVPCKE